MRPGRSRVCLAGGLLLLAAATTARAAPTVNVGTVTLFANTLNSPFLIDVTGGDAVQGLNLDVQVGNGLTGGPSIVSVDIIGPGTIFHSSNTGQSGAGLIGSQFFEATTTTNPAVGGGSVAALGTLARITIDTTGYFSGDFDLKLSGTLNGSSNFGNLAGSFTNGTLHLVAAPVPEPGAVAVIGVAVTALLRRTRLQM